jgi:ferric-dicitrate binding protein FerR (iron transport regulator)
MMALAASLALVLGAGGVALQRRVASQGATVVAMSASIGTFTAPGEAPRSLGAEESLPEASRISTPQGGSAELSFSTGTRVALGSSSDVTLDAVEARQQLYLAHGRLNAHVAHVAKGSSFQVVTRDAEIEVKGTVFTVEVGQPAPECAGGTTTRVFVEEGVVAVRFAGTEVLLHAGDQWPKSCEAAANTPLPEAAVETSSLAAQNDLFAQAAALKHHGDVAGAIALYEHLLEAWPQGPLSESATVERMKLVAEQNRLDGVRAAREYLSKYPHGFAREEAKRLLDGR